MKRHGRSIYGCTQAPEEFRPPADCRLTYNPESCRLYVHAFAWPFKHMRLEGFGGKVKYAQLLNDASEIRIAELAPHQAQMEGLAPDTLVLELPVAKPQVAVPVIELFLD